MAGPERKSRVMSETEKRMIAYHEAGHALVGHVLPNADRSTRSRSSPAAGRSGWTLSLPTRTRYITARSRAARRDGRCCSVGAAAEELVFGDHHRRRRTTSRRATQIARAMVTQYGMSDTLGPQQLGNRTRRALPRQEMGHEVNYSDEIAAADRRRDPRPARRRPRRGPRDPHPAPAPRSTASPTHSWSARRCRTPTWHRSGTSWTCRGMIGRSTALTAHGQPHPNRENPNRDEWRDRGSEIGPRT